MQNQLFSRLSLSEENVSIVRGVAADVIYKNIITVQTMNIPIKLKNFFLVICFCLFYELRIAIIVDF